MRRVLLVDAVPMALAQLQSGAQADCGRNGTRRRRPRRRRHWRYWRSIATTPSCATSACRRWTDRSCWERCATVTRTWYALCLSDNPDDDAFLRAQPVTNQFLNKPCNVENLSEVLERICSLRDILQHPAIHELIGNLKALPATPHTFQALSSAIAKPNVHAADVAQIVSKDTALSVKVLQLANSAFYRRGVPVTSIQTAISYAGLEMIKSLALSACVFSALDASPGAIKRLQDLQGRSLRKAHFARMLLRESRHAEEAFTAALLLDIGQAVLALSAPEKFEHMIELARTSGRAWHEVELEVFGAAHPEVGAYLLGLWGLPLDPDRSRRLSPHSQPRAARAHQRTRGGACGRRHRRCHGRPAGEAARSAGCELRCPHRGVAVPDRLEHPHRRR